MARKGRGLALVSYVQIEQCHRDQHDPLLKLTNCCVCARVNAEVESHS